MPKTKITYKTCTYNIGESRCFNDPTKTVLNKQYAVCGMDPASKKVVCMASVKVELGKVTLIDFFREAGGVVATYVDEFLEHLSVDYLLDKQKSAASSPRNFYDVVIGDHSLSVVITPDKDIKTDLSNSYWRYETCNYDLNGTPCQSTGKFDSVAKCTMSGTIQTCVIPVNVVDYKVIRVFFKRFSKDLKPEIVISRPPNQCAIVASTYVPDVEIRLRNDAGNQSGSVNVYCDDVLKGSFKISADSQPLHNTSCSFGSGQHHVRVANTTAPDSAWLQLGLDVVVPSQISVLKADKTKDNYTSNLAREYSTPFFDYALDKEIVDPKTGEFFRDRLEGDMVQNGLGAGQMDWDSKIKPYLSKIGFNGFQTNFLWILMSGSKLIVDGKLDVAKAFADLSQTSTYMIDGVTYINFCRSLVW